MTLDEISIILVYSAMAVYAIAFIAYAIDLARRSAVATKAADAWRRCAGGRRGDRDIARDRDRRRRGRERVSLGRLRH